MVIFKIILFLMYVRLMNTSTLSMSYLSFIHFILRDSQHIQGLCLSKFISNTGKYLLNTYLGPDTICFRKLTTIDVCPPRLVPRLGYKTDYNKFGENLKQCL